MKREEIKSIIENAEMDVDAKLKAIMDINGKEVTDLKASRKELEDKVKGTEDLQAKYDELSKQVDTYKGFEEKATKYDSIFTEYESLKKDAHFRKVSDSAKASGIKDEFIEFAIAKVGEVENYDEAFKKFADEHKQFTNSVEKVISTNPELNKGKADVEIDYSKIY